MVGSAVETEDNSRAERERQIHIETKMSQNLAPFLDGGVFDWTKLLSLTDGNRIMGRPLEHWEGIRRPSTDLAGICQSSGHCKLEKLLRLLKHAPQAYIMMIPFDSV
jgi:hypothetical protein